MDTVTTEQKPPTRKSSIMKAMELLNVMLDEIHDAHSIADLVERKDKIVTALLGARLITKQVFDAETRRRTTD
jgi:hypothetical protein